MKDQRLFKLDVFAIVSVFSILLVLAVLSRGAIAAEQVSYRLKWLFNMSVAGDIYADVHQFFQSQGLTVTIKEGGPERDAIRELELGRAQFGSHPFPVHPP